MKAIDLDPQYARAYVGLGWAHLQSWYFFWSAGPEGLERARELAEQAMALDDTLIEGHSLLGQTHLWRKEHDRAIAAAERAVALGPNSAEGYETLAEVLAWAGRPEESLGFIHQAMRLNPRYPFFYLWTLGHASYLLGRNQEAVETLGRVTLQNPNFLPAHAYLAVLFAEMGRAGGSRGVEQGQWDQPRHLGREPQGAPALPACGGPGPIPERGLQGGPVSARRGRRGVVEGGPTRRSVTSACRFEPGIFDLMSKGRRSRGEAGHFSWEGTMDHTVVHFEIPTDNPERAATFYRELFGWDIQKWASESGPDYWMVSTVPADGAGQPTRPGVNGGLLRRHHPGHMPVNYIGVESVDDFARKARRLGAQDVMPKTPVKGMGWFAWLKDTEGNVCTPVCAAIAASSLFARV